MKSNSWVVGACTAGLLIASGLLTPYAHAHDVAQVPLLVSGSGVPGNLTLVPSVEYPTIDSQASIGNFNTARWYSGYFDNKKCYEYKYSNNEPDRHFSPVSFTTDGRCTGKLWSGNYMNWAATQTIDPFRLALTGGDRVKDTVTETWVQKARHDRAGLFANRVLNTNVNSFTPASWTSVTTKIQGLGFVMRFTRDGGGSVRAYDPGNSSHKLDNSDPKIEYEVSVRVKVCVSGLLESDGRCKQYGSNYKPEGLIQEYSDRIRYSIFGYLNETGNQRNGGVMRARQKFVGPYTYTAAQGAVNNPNKEWSESTGVLVRNPDPVDASNTSGTQPSIQDSGVINYLNKFGRMTSNIPKGNDPVSELYYTALRYFMGKGNYSEYSNFASSANATTRYAHADGFPVITNWDDPIAYSCQVNAILGIGDVNTHADHDIPAPDKALAQAATQKVFSMEGITTAVGNEYTGRGNSAYIAGLAYYANTNDLRADDPDDNRTLGKQTISTYWVDVRENQILEPKNRNQYYLTAKYGGFKVPAGFDYGSFAGPLPQEWWHNNGEYLTSGSGGDVTTTPNAYPRADNFFLASEADKMVASLRTAFQRIASAAAQAAGGIAASGARATTDLLAYVPSYDTTDWTGNLTAYLLNPDGSLKEPPAWNAKSKLAASNDSAVRSQTGRKVFYIDPSASAGARQREFTVSGLGGGTAASSALGFASATDVDAQFPGRTITDVVNYLRGDHSLERRNGGSFRDRSGRLGDIFGSQPAVLDKASYGYLNLPAAQGGGYGAGKYATFVASKETRGPLVVVGSNDGFLHAFDASSGSNGGREIWALAPASVLANMGRLPSSDYVHHYFVDGSPTQGDAYLGGAWKTVMLVPTGAGGKSVFAIDVTQGASAANPSVLWEFMDEDLGYAVGQPKIAVLNDGRWVAVFGNGYASTNHKAYLYVVNLTTGSLIAKIAAGNEGDASKPNALAGPAVIDVDYDGITDLVYAGDYYGNMWRFDLAAGTGGTKTVPDLATLTPNLLFTATDSASGNRQPITGGVTASIHPIRGRLVFFGTGQYMMVGDNDAPKASDQIQSFYGIWDDPNTSTAVPRNTLKEQKINVGGGVGSRVITDSVVNWGTHQGWFVDLKLVSSSGALVGTPQGERFIGQPTVALGRVFFTTFVTAGGDLCDPKGANWLNALWATSGAGALGSGSETTGSVQLDGGSSPISSAITIVTNRKGGDTGCQPGDPGCISPVDVDEDGNPIDLTGATPQACIVDVSMLTALGLNPLLQVSCGRQSWREWE